MGLETTCGDEAMRYTAAQAAGILAEARAHLNKRPTGPREREATTSKPQSELVFKAIDDAIAPTEHRTAAGSSELPWWEWVDQRLDARLEAHGEETGTAIADFCGPQFAALKRQIQLLEREVTQLREQVALERGLRDLRTEVEVARAEVPKLPAIAARLERGQARLERELETTQQKLKRTRVDQRIADHQLTKLREATEQRAASVEMKFETTVSSFRMHEIHPDAARAMKNFADAALKAAPKWAPSADKIWMFDPSVTVAR
jgi:chromosome segregation ATPase